MHNLTLGTRAQNIGSNRASEGGGMGYPETQYITTLKLKFIMMYALCTIMMNYYHVVQM